MILVHPDTAVGWCHIWAEGEQLPISEEVAYTLALIFKLIVYSPEDGPNAKVYRLCEGVTLEKVKTVLGLN